MLSRFKASTIQEFHSLLTEPSYKRALLSYEDIILSEMTACKLLASLQKEIEAKAIVEKCISVLQGEIYVSSMTCLGKNTANIWIHQVVCSGKKGRKNH